MRLLIIFVLLSIHASGQNKKTQIENLNHTIDSLNTIVSETKIKAKQEEEALRFTIASQTAENKQLKDEISKLNKTQAVQLQEIEKLKSDLALLTQQKLELEAKLNSIEQEKIRAANSYKTVQIGQQIWMSENLNIKQFKNGDPIPQSKSPEEWLKYHRLRQATWCYSNFQKQGEIFYNSFAIIDPRGIAPEGFKIPDNEDWRNLGQFIDPNFKKYGIYKDYFGDKERIAHFKTNGYVAEQLASTTGWNDDSYRYKNSVGFNAKPVGYLNVNGKGSLDFFEPGVGTCYWTANSHVWIGHDGGFCFGLGEHGGDISNFEDGYSIRCIKY